MNCGIFTTLGLRALGDLHSVDCHLIFILRHSMKDSVRWNLKWRTLFEHGGMNENKMHWMSVLLIEFFTSSGREIKGHNDPGRIGHFACKCCGGKTTFSDDSSNHLRVVRILEPWCIQNLVYFLEFLRTEQKKKTLHFQLFLVPFNYGPRSDMNKSASL